MNEELQSTNDELHTINDTLRERSVELDEARSFLGALANSIRLGMVVVDREMRVVEWNRGSEQLWGMRADETIGQSLTSLDIGLPLGDVKPLIGNAFVDGEADGQTVVDAVNRRGRHTKVKVTCTSFRSTEGPVSGALLRMEEVE
jgi:two-component system CheB/CheR fusion protein